MATGSTLQAGAVRHKRRNSQRDVGKRRSGSQRDQIMRAVECEAGLHESALTVG